MTKADQVTLDWLGSALLVRAIGMQYSVTVGPAPNGRGTIPKIVNASTLFMLCFEIIDVSGESFSFL